MQDTQIILQKDLFNIKAEKRTQRQDMANFHQLAIFFFKKKVKQQIKKQKLKDLKIQKNGYIQNDLLKQSNR